MKTKLFREINGRFLLIEQGDPIFYCINSIRTVFPKQNNKVSKSKSVKMMVLLHPQGGKHKFNQAVCHSRAVPQLEFGRVRQYRCNS